MERFTKVPAKITAEGLETQDIDYKRGQMIEEHARRADDEKHFIKANMKGVRQTQMEFKMNEMSTKASKDKKKAFENKNVAKIPAYLRRFREEEEKERLETLREIELNKRPPDTRVVSAKEKETVLAELNGRKQCYWGKT